MRIVPWRLFGYVQRVLAINEFAGEKAIPDAVKLKYRPGCPVESFERSVLDAADKLILEHFHFAPDELEFSAELRRFGYSPGDIPSTRTNTRSKYAASVNPQSCVTCLTFLSLSTSRRLAQSERAA